MYERPVIADLGSIADHTFTVCNPDGAIVPDGKPGNPKGPPPKGPAVGNWHFDKFRECSSLS